MTGRAPTLVVLYALRGKPANLVRSAEFRLTPEGRVELSIIEPDGGALAEEYYEHGVDLATERRVVQPADGAVFMRALLQPFRMSYYYFADESDRENPDAST
jgi:hypothetical protein